MRGYTPGARHLHGLVGTGVSAMDLGGTQPVYRALTKGAWVTDSQPRKVTAAAFLAMRPRDGSRLSASLDALGLFRRLNDVRGVACLLVAAIRGVTRPDGAGAELDVCPEPTDDDPFHVVIRDLPPKDTWKDPASFALAHHLAQELAKLAEFLDQAACQRLADASSWGRPSDFPQQ